MRPQRLFDHKKKSKSFITNNLLRTMPPAAAKVGYYDGPIEEEPVNANGDIRGIEVQAVSRDDNNKSGVVVTRIVMLPSNEENSDEQRETKMMTTGDGQLGGSAASIPCLFDRGSRFDVHPQGHGATLADSFDSFDEIPEDSNDAKLIKSLAQKADSIPFNPASALGEQILQNGGVPHHPYELDETEAKYLGVLDGRVEETDAQCTSSSELDHPDDPHPNEADIGDITDSLFEIPCCECVQERKPLRSALRPSKWTAGSEACPSDHDDVPTSAHLPVPGETPRSRSVTFNEVAIKEFNMTLGNHPSATSGPPVMMDWDSRPKTQTISLEQYEQAREPRRNRRQLKLSLQQRHGILVKDGGFSFEQVKSAWQEALEIRKQRKETLERGLAMMKWDEVWESTCRKFNRLVDAAL